MTVEKRLDLLKKLEKACYNCTFDKAIEDNIITSWDDQSFCDIYHAICAKISMNISSFLVNNTTLPKLILEGRVSLPSLPNRSSQDLFPEKYVDIMKKVEASKTATVTFKTTAMYRCPQCKKNECIYENRYNRSLDEGVNLYITCMNCSYQWCA